MKRRPLYEMNGSPVWFWCQYIFGIHRGKYIILCICLSDTGETLHAIPILYNVKRKNKFWRHEEDIEKSCQLPSTAIMQSISLHQLVTYMFPRMFHKADQ